MRKGEAFLLTAVLFFFHVQVRGQTWIPEGSTSQPFYYTTPPPLPYSTAPSCDQLTVMENDTGVIKMPKNGDYLYQNNLDCEWQINLAENNIILIQFTSFELEGSSSCSYDYVLVLDGYNGNNLYKGKICESNIPLMSLSSSNKVVVKFHSDSSVVYSGFSINYTVYHKSPADCELNGTLYLVGTTLYEKDCYGYICQNGQFERTTNTDQICCSLGWQYADGSYTTYADYGYFLDYYTYSSTDGVYGINATISRPNCPDAICVAKNNWETKDCKMCVYSGHTFNHNDAIFQRDCLEYRCNNGSLEPTGRENSACCYYSWYDYSNDWGNFPYNYGTNEPYGIYYGPNGSLPTPNCTERVCVSYGTWAINQLDPTHCKTCEDNGYQYRENMTVYKEDCYEYVCQNESWEKTGLAKRDCCWYRDPVINGYYGYENYYGINTTISRPKCSNITCVANNTWASDDCKMCWYNGQQNDHRTVILHDDCRYYRCENGEWTPTKYTEQNCCYYSYYQYQTEWNGLNSSYSGFDGYFYKSFEFNESIPMPNCSELVCNASSTWLKKTLDPEICITCEYNGVLFRTNWTRYGDDCLQYICRSGNWERTSGTNSDCCYISSSVYYQYFTNIDKYYSGLNSYLYKYIGLGETLPTSSCTELICVNSTALDTRELDSASCTKKCEFNGIQYSYNWRRYGNDCLEYVCQNEGWVITNHTDQQCCTGTNFDYGYYFYYPSYYYYYGLNQSYWRDYCSDLICVARGTWESEDCHVCNYNSQTYGDQATVFQNDCLEYSCNNGIWNTTGNTNRYCCSYVIPTNIDYYAYSIYYELNATVSRPNCSNMTCVAQNNWKSDDCKMCWYNGLQHDHMTVNLLGDCRYYRCVNGEWKATKYTSQGCCSYSYYEYQTVWGGLNSSYSGFDGYFYRSFEVNESVPMPNCSERVCNASNTWLQRDLSPEDCTTCEYNGVLFRTNWTRFGDDCLQYICQSGNWHLTNETNSQCCYYNQYEYWLDWGSTEFYPLGIVGLADRYYERFQTLPASNCTERICANNSTWDFKQLDSSSCLQCEFKGVNYSHNWRRYEDDCYERVCENGVWMKTSHTDSQCCYYYTWQYYYEYFYNTHAIFGYHGLNESVWRNYCSDLICVARDTWESEDCKVCNGKGVTYPDQYTMYKEDCLQYVCDNGVWNKTGIQDPYCCYNYDEYYGPGEQAYDYYRRYLWWFVNKNNWYQDLQSTWKYSVAINETVYSSTCQQRTCISRNTLVDTGERNQNCCVHRNTWYSPYKPLYQDDCIGYVCLQGNWTHTQYTDPECCFNPEWVGQESYNYDYENWWADYDFAQPWWYGTDSSESGAEWYRKNTTITRFDCKEVVCTARDTWLDTGKAVLNCTPTAKNCEFNGTVYNHTDKLPGCMKVYCVNGDWLQNGYIDPLCSRCYAQWDPHLKTFDGYYYDYQGTCNYSLAQDGTSLVPRFAIFSEFFNCWGAACVGPSTYKDSPNTVITMGADGRYAPQLYTLYVNGVQYVIPDGIPRLVMEGISSHPVFAWRYGSCIRLLGSSKFSVQKCGSSLDIWVSYDFYDSLYGLCGYYDGNVTNDFTKRDLTQASLQQNPLGSEFPDSWEVTGGCSSGNAQGRKKREAQVGSCEASSEYDDIKSMCDKINSSAVNTSTAEEVSALYENCMYDLCTVAQNTSGDIDALDLWMGDIMGSVQEIADSQDKTADDDEMPEPLPITRPEINSGSNVNSTMSGSTPPFWTTPGFFPTTPFVTQPPPGASGPTRTAQSFSGTTPFVSQTPPGFSGPTRTAQPSGGTTPFGTRPPYGTTSSYGAGTPYFTKTPPPIDVSTGEHSGMVTSPTVAHGKPDKKTNCRGGICSYQVQVQIRFEIP